MPKSIHWTVRGRSYEFDAKKKKKIATQFLKRTFLTLVLGMIEVPQTMQTLSSSYYTESHNKVFRGKFRCVVLEIIGSIT